MLLLAGAWHLTIPRPEAFIDTRVWIVGRLLAGQFLFHATHPCAKRVAPGAALGLWSFQTRLAGVGCVVGGSTLGVQAALLGLAFLARPCGTSHRTPLIWTMLVA